jgi:hypothetical protein
MNAPVEIQTVFRDRSRLAAAALIFGLFAAFVTIGTGSAIYGLACLTPLVVVAAFLLRAERARPTTIVIDPIQKEVVAHYNNLPGKKHKTWALDRWNAVQTFTLFESGGNVVVLRASDGSSDALLLSEFDAGFKQAKSWASLPVACEAVEAARLRERLVATGLFHDRGFSHIWRTVHYVN